MREVLIANLEPGMITAKPVTTPSGQLIINKGVELDKKLIARIDFYSIESAWIEGEEKVEEPVAAPEPEVQEPPAEDDRIEFLDAGNPSYSQKITRSQDFQDFSMAYARKLAELKQAFEVIPNRESFDSLKFMKFALDFLGTKKVTTIELFDKIHNIRQVDDSVYAHSLNVAMIARILGTWMKYDHDTLDQLTIAGLLHDFGKLQVPDNILNKPGKLTDTEFQIVKMHPTMGFDALSHLDLDPRVLKAILQHHERSDGSGYPIGIKGGEIDEFTTIISIADVYDAMTAARKYRDPLCPFEVIGKFEEDGLQKYNPTVILTFLKRIAHTYHNNRVMLSDGRQATVVLLNDNHLSKPIVKFDDEQFLDLTTCSTRIVSVL